MNNQEEDEKKKTDLRDMNPFKSGNEKVGPFSPEDILSLTPLGRAAKFAKAAKAAKAGGVLSKIRGFFSKRSKPQTAPKAPKPPKSRGKLTKTLSKVDLPSLPNLKGLSAVTGAIRKMAKPEEEEKLKREAYQRLGNSLLHKLNEEGLRAWFGNSRSKGGKPGWVQVVSGKPCARQPGQKSTPKCVSSSKRASMTPAQRRSAQARKRRADPNQRFKTGAAKPTYVPTDKPKKKAKGKRK